MREANDFRRVAAIGGVAAVAIVALLVGKHPFFATTVPEVPPAHATEPQRAEGETSPVIDPDHQFFFGAGDGSKGYYASGKRTLLSSRVSPPWKFRFAAAETLVRRDQVRK